MNDKFKIIIQSQLDESSNQIQVLNDQITRIGKQLNSIDLKINVPTNTESDLSKMNQLIKDNIDLSQKSATKSVSVNTKSIGVFKELTKEQTSSIDIAKALSREMGFLEIRGHSLNKMTGEYSVTLRKSSDENLVLKGSIDQATGALTVQNEIVQQARNIQLGWIDQLGIAISRTVTWAIAVGGFYSQVRKFREGIDIIRQLDSELTQVSVITGINRDEMRDLAKEYARLGEQMNKTAVDISRINTELVRQGLSLEEANERMQTILKMSSAGSMSVDDTLKVITSSVNALGVESERAADVMLKAGAISASSAGQIGEALTKTASSAKLAGLSIEELSAILSTLVEVTQESPSSLGTSINTVISRFNRVNLETGELNENLNTVQKAFESVGITFLDTAGQIRPVGDLLTDLAGRWENLNKNTQMMIANQAAGVRQQNRFLALMDNFARKQEIQNELMEAGGTLNEQYARYLDSVQAAADRATVAFEKMWVNALNSDVIKMFYDLITAITGTIDKIGLFKTALVALLTIVIASNATFKTFNSLMYESVTSMGFAKGMSELLKTSFLGLSGAAIAAKVAVTALHVALSLGLSLAITAAISGITKLITNMKSAKQQQEELAASIVENSKAIQESLSDVKLSSSLIDEYERLNKQLENNEIAADKEAETK